MTTKRFLPLLLLAFAAITAQGQIFFEVATDRQNYIHYEEVLLKVTLRNDSGNPLSFGGDSGGRVIVEVWDPDGTKIRPKEGYLDAGTNLDLPPGGSKSVIIPVNAWYALHRLGHYRMNVRVSHPRLPHDYVSPQLQFKVSGGTEYWQRDVGLPGATEGTEIPMRQVSINVFQADRSQLYYLMIRDDKWIYCVTRLAPRVRGVLPQVEIDARSQIHFFVQTQPCLFSHYVYDLNGQEKQTEHYVVEEYLPIPQLIRDPDIGRVMVSGGRRAKDGIDYNDVTLPVMEAKAIPNKATEEKP